MPDNDPKVDPKLIDKRCPICGKTLADNDLTIVLLMARYHPTESSYTLEAMQQTLVSHLFCVEKKPEAKV